MSPPSPDRVLLALDTSATVGSVAVARGTRVLARAFLEDRGAHAAGIVPAVDRTLEEAGLGREEVDGVVVGSGPGSFTGVRVAVATARGLARGLDRPLWALSSLAAAALGDTVLGWEDGPWPPTPGVEPLPRAELAGAPRYVLLDARATRVYAGCYRPRPDGLDVLAEPTATRLEEVLAGRIPEGAAFAGSGALRHRDRIREAGHLVLPSPAGMPTADGLLRILDLDAGAAPLDAARAWEPEYLRSAGAERERAG